jgi:hypothetical protein
VLDQFAYPCRSQPDPVFMGLDFSWDADLHVLSPAR